MTSTRPAGSAGEVSTSYGLSESQTVALRMGSTDYLPILVEKQFRVYGFRGYPSFLKILSRGLVDERSVHRPT